MSGEARKIATFLEIPIDEAKWPTILNHCCFDYMKANATTSIPLGGAFWDGGAQTFVHKGTNGRWRDTLSAEDSAAYEARAIVELGQTCPHRLLTGRSSG